MGSRGPQPGAIYQPHRPKCPTVRRVASPDQHRAAVRLAARVGALVDELQSETRRGVLEKTEIETGPLLELEARLVDAAAVWTLREADAQL